MNFASLGASIWTGIQKIPALVWWLVLGLLFFKWVELSSLSRGKKEKADEIAKKQAEVKAAVNERVDEIITEERSNADAAIEARSTGTHYPDAASLPDELRSIGFRNPRGS